MDGYPCFPSAPMKWFKMKVLGRGSYGTVHLAMATTNTTGSSSSGFIAVKSAVIEKSFSLMKEAEILQEFVNCPEVVRGLGFDISYEGGLWFYNLLLEYASGGTLQDLIQTSGGKLDEIDVKKYTRMILKGLRCIHEKGYVHCDLKPENILVFSSPHGARSKSVKITDFGLSKIPGDLNELMTKRYDFRGTPLYMSPESFLVGEIKGCLDIWSLGCVVVEMISGKPVWDSTGSLDGLVIQIATESPNIPETMSEIGKDFLRRCFAWDPTERWTAEMLLHHPFLLETQALPPSTKTTLDFSVSKKLPPPPGFGPIAKRPSLPKTLPPPPPGFGPIAKRPSLPKTLPPPPPGFGPIAKRPSLPKTLPPTPPGFESIRKNLPPPPGFSSRRILA